MPQVIYILTDYTYTYMVLYYYLPLYLFVKLYFPISWESNWFKKLESS